MRVEIERVVSFLFMLGVDLLSLYILLLIVSEHLCFSFSTFCDEAFFPLPDQNAGSIKVSSSSRLKRLQQSSLEQKNRKQREQQGQQQVFHF